MSEGLQKQFTEATTLELCKSRLDVAALLLDITDKKLTPATQAKVLLCAETLVSQVLADIVAGEE